MDEHDIKCNPETKRNREQVNNIKPIVAPKGQLLGTPQRSRQFCYEEKFLFLVGWIKVTERGGGESVIYQSAYF